MTFERKRYRIAIDTGGTFVDAVEFDEENKYRCPYDHIPLRTSTRKKRIPHTAQPRQTPHPFS
jgi:N-methylhydantoinase A/oxoprolinase/acetone carboxylase beta subunit